MIEGTTKGVSEMDKVAHQRLEDLTVIIPTLGRPVLQKCLQVIAEGSKVPASIVVIDQGDNPLVVNWLAGLQVKEVKTFHLRSIEKGPASARNKGMELVQTRFVAAIDDDCYAEPDWLEKMSINLHQNPEAIITGRVEPDGEGVAATIVTSPMPRIYRYPSVRFPSPLTTGNMGFALKTFQTVGPFDIDLLTSEDNDWAYRALRIGIPILYSPEIVVYHYHWRDKSQEVSNYDSYAWGLGVFYGKHLRRGDMSMILRTGISIFRGLRELIQGSLLRDNTRRMNGLSRITKLLPGLFAGLRGSGSR